jgi:hypothetical protein
MVREACVASPDSLPAPASEIPDAPAVPPRVPSAMPEQDLTIWTPLHAFQAFMRALMPEREAETLPIRVRNRDRV